MSLKIKIEGLTKLDNYFKDYKIRKKNEILWAVASVAEEIRFDAIAYAPRDLGELKANITSQVIDRRQEVIGNINSNATYSAFVEFGSRPHWAPYSALDGWAKRHGIPTMAVLIKIAREGTPAQPFMLPAAVKNKNKFVRNIVTIMSTK